MIGARAAYRLGLLQTLLMGLYHFALPWQWQWSALTADWQPTLRWALFSLNGFFSYVLVLSSSLAWWHTRIEPGRAPLPLVAFGFAGWWLFAFGWQTLWPMPLPAALGFLRWLLPLIALLNAALFLMATFRPARSD
jgi:hypothetical protein